MMNLVVLSCLVAAVSASALLGVSPLAYGAYGAYGSPLLYGAPLLAPSNYRGPLSLAPGQPANILAADGRPLDTLDVNLDRAAHYTAKALDGGLHLLKKRSVALATPIAAPLISRVYSPLAYSAPLAYAAPAPLAYSARIAHPYAYTAPLAHAFY